MTPKRKSARNKEEESARKRAAYKAKKDKLPEDHPDKVAHCSAKCRDCKEDGEDLSEFIVRTALSKKYYRSEFTGHANRFFRNKN